MQSSQAASTRPRFVCHIPILVVIVFAALVSISSSLAGGLVIYYEGLRSLERALDQTSEGELNSLFVGLRSVEDTSVEYLGQLKQFLYSQKQINTTDTREWVSKMHSIFFAQVNASKNLYYSAVFLHPYAPRANGSFFYATVWSDLYADGRRQMLIGESGPHFSPYRMGNALVVKASLLERATGEVSNFLYYWLSGIRGYDSDGVTYTIDPAKDVIADAANVAERFRRATLVPHAHAESRRGPRLWHTPPDFLYSYYNIDAIYFPPPAPHPWHTLRAVRISVGYLSSAFQDVMDSHRHSEGTLILMVSRAASVMEDGRVIAATIPGFTAVPTECQGSGIQSGEAGRLGCYVNITAHFAPTVQDAYRLLGGTSFGTFIKASVGGEDHFLRRAVVPYTHWELIWMRPVSAVDGDVREALYLLVIFVALVVVFDSLISIIEVFFIALPLRRLASAIGCIGNMHTEAALEFMKTDQSRTLMVKEIGRLMDGTTATILKLEEYRSFLPQTILDQRVEEGSARQEQREAPCGEEVAVVFTDIRGSTQLWEACHSGMSVGLRLHNQLVRSCIARHKGYEVKTIGDAFMVVFDTPDQAVLFALDVQDGLTRLDWPQDLVEEPLCSIDAAGDWAGIRVRIGLAYGPAQAVRDDLAQRYDYFGPTVNRAARLEGVSKAGALALEGRVVEQLSQSTCAEAATIPMGECHLKGIAEAVSVHLMVPKSLPRRAAFMKGNLGPVHRDSDQASYRSYVSSGGASAAGDAPAVSPAHPLTGLKVHTAVASRMATIGQLTQMLDISEPPQSNYFVTAVMSVLQRTDGMLLAVSGGAVEVGWNVGAKACAAHVEAAFRFAGWVCRSLAVNVRCGISTGLLRTDNVGSQGRRFVAAIGKSAMHAAATLYRTERLGVQFVYTSGDSQTVPHLCDRGFLRPVETCVVAGHSLVLHEMHIARITEWCDDKLAPLMSKSDNTSETGKEGLPWGPQYCAAYHADDVDGLAGFADDPVVAGVHTRMSERVGGKGKGKGHIAAASRAWDGPSVSTDV